MKQAIFYLLGIVGKILFFLFTIIVVIQVLTANLAFVLSIYHDRLKDALIAMSISYVLASILTYCLYYIDKNAARKGNRRIPEVRLHQLELIGGWFGAFLGQKQLRHKSIKSSYQMVYWLIVFFHLSLFLLFLPAIFPQFAYKKYVVILNFFLLFIAISAIGKR
jgi:uncharacterized membrane protein YsdA (DUF1294 family)